MAVKQRARKQEDKAARRRAILSVAAQMLGQTQYQRITMAEVARHCQLAKGTLYLYFRSKEELFLAALGDELEAWFDALVVELIAGLPVADGPGHLADTVARTLAERQALTDLLPLVHTVLEQNIDLPTALSFKQMLLTKMAHGSQVVERVVPGLPPGSGAQVLLRLYALVLALRQMSDPSPVVAEVLARPEMSPLRVDFATELAGSLAAMVRGMVRVHAVPDPG